MSSPEAPASTSPFHGSAARRFSATQAAFQFATVSFVAIVVIFIAVASALAASPPGTRRWLLLAGCVVLIVPAVVSVRLVLRTISDSLTIRTGAMTGHIKSIAATTVIAMGLLLASDLVPASPQVVPPAALGAFGALDTHRERESARFLFDLDDLSTIQLVSYAKTDGRIAAEFRAEGRTISVVVARGAP